MVTKGVEKDVELGGPTGLAVDSKGNVYVARAGPYCLYQITPEGVIHRILDQSGDAGGHPLDLVRAVAVDAKDAVYVTGMGSDNLMRFTPPAATTKP